MSSVSCIIVSYNNCKYIKQAITSVVNQTMSISEIIVADDGSTDGSREILTSLANQYSNIRLIFREKNLGVSANRDLAIREAQGDFITTLDGDDYYFPQKIEKEYLSLNQSNSFIAYSDIQLVNASGQYIRKRDISAFLSLNKQEKLRCLALRLVDIPRDMLVLKKAYIEVGGINHNIDRYEDWDFKIRLANQYSQWSYSGIEGIVYRRALGSLSAMSLQNHIQWQFKVVWLNRELLINQLGYLNFLQVFNRILFSNLKCIPRRYLLRKSL